MNSRVCHLRGLIKAGKQVDGMYFANGAHQGCFASMHWHQLVTASELNFGYVAEYWNENLLRYDIAKLLMNVMAEHFNAQHITSRIFKALFNIMNFPFDLPPYMLCHVNFNCTPMSYTHHMKWFCITFS